VTRSPMRSTAKLSSRKDRTLGTREEPPLGAHLVSRRPLYTHHGIYVGGGYVIHYSGFSSKLRAGPVEEVSLEEFAQGRGISVRADAASYSDAQIIARAHARLGEHRYRLLSNNCRHFCDWCRRGPLPIAVATAG
jgi:hypothetical protein